MLKDTARAYNIIFNFFNNLCIIVTKNAALFHLRPLIVLYNLAETYPAIRPIKTYKKMAAVIRAPREAGDNIPNMAKTRT